MRFLLLAVLVAPACSGCETKTTPSPSEKPSATPAPAVAEPIAPEKLCSIYVGLADAETKLDPAAKEAKEKRCLGLAQGLKASNETQYKCLVDCTQKAKAYAEARACQRNCRGGRKGGTEGTVGGAPGGGVDDDPL
jgi:hypothetical protein